MLSKLCLVLVCILALTATVYNRHFEVLSFKGLNQNCYEHGCPVENTTSCYTVAVPSEDWKDIIIKTQCYKWKDNFLNVTNFEKNPFEPGSGYRGVRLSLAPLRNKIKKPNETDDNPNDNAEDINNIEKQ